MQTALRLTGTVRPGGRVEVSSPQLPTGEAVEVIVLFTQQTAVLRRSVVDVVGGAPGQLAFHTPEDVDAYIQEERDAWDL